MSETLGEKEKAEALRALCEGSFKRRYELETLQWRMNFSLWTGIAVAAWALHNKPEHLRWWSLLFLLVILFQCYFVYRFALAERRAVDFAFSYLKELEELADLKSKMGNTQRTWIIQWYLLAVFPTMLLVAVAIRLVW